MAKKVLSIFIDESGDFGTYKVHSPNYYVAMVFHDQSLELAEAIDTLDLHLKNIGYPNHTVLSKVISDELKRNYDYLNSFDLQIVYYDFGQPSLTTIITSVFNALFSNVEFRKVQPAEYKLFQVADLICTMELTNDKAERNALSKSELEFFHSARDFKKNLYKQLAKKKL